MKSLSLTLCPALLVAGMLSSCVGKFSATERRSLETVAILRTEVKSDAYQRPNGGSDAAAGAGGAVGGILGATIGLGIKGIQNSSFQKGNGDSVAQLAAKTPKNVGDLLNVELTSVLKRNAFFAPRLRPQAPAHFQSSVREHGLVRNGTRNGEILFTPRLITDYEIKDSTGRKIASTFCIASATSSHTIGEYVGNPKLLEFGYTEASRNTAKQMEGWLAKKTKP